MYTLKKALGQHFLKDESIIANIVKTLQQEKFTRLLEVGPGGGALTKSLLSIPGIEFKAVELDAEKVDYLHIKFPVLKDKIIHQNFLDMEMPFQESFILIGNFPYNISSQILFKALEWKDQLPVIIGMFQKEVAQRAAAAPGSKTYGVLSALIQPYYHIEYLFDVPPSSFTPEPKVMSGVIKLRRKEKQLAYKSDKKYILLVKTAFNQRRKTLRNAVKSIFMHDVLQQDIFNKRAEQISIDEFAALTFLMQ